MLTNEEIDLIAAKVAQHLSNENKKQEFNPDNNGCGCFYLIFNLYGMASHWIGSSGVKKDFEEMVEFITDELQGEFKITQF